MTVQASVALRNARLDAIETLVGVSPVVKIISGSLPASCATADAGTVLATFNLASDWASAASAGVKNLSNTPVQDTSADATGTAGHWRLFDSSGTCHLQGDITVTGGGGSMTVASLSITLSGLVQITSWAMTEGDA